MSDISKCEGKNCEQKETCYRFTAPESKWQSYIFPDAESCQMYWPIEVKKSIPFNAADGESENS